MWLLALVTEAFSNRQLLICYLDLVLYSRVWRIRIHSEIENVVLVLLLDLIKHICCRICFCCLIRNKKFETRLRGHWLFGHFWSGQLLLMAREYVSSLAVITVSKTGCGFTSASEGVLCSISSTWGVCTFDRGSYIMYEETLLHWKETFRQFEALTCY